MADKTGIVVVIIVLGIVAFLGMQIFTQFSGDEFQQAVCEEDIGPDAVMVDDGDNRIDCKKANGEVVQDVEVNLTGPARGPTWYLASFGLLGIVIVGTITLSVVAQKVGPVFYWYKRDES